MDCSNDFTLRIYLAAQTPERASQSLDRGVRSLWRMHLADKPVEKATHEIRMKAAAKQAIESCDETVGSLKNCIPLLGLTNNSSVSRTIRVAVKPAGPEISSALAAFNRAEEVTHLMQFLNDGNLTKTGDLVRELLENSKLTEACEHDFIGVLREYGIEPLPELMEVSDNNQNYQRSKMESLLRERGLLDRYSKAKKAKEESPAPGS